MIASPGKASTWITRPWPIGWAAFMPFMLHMLQHISAFPTFPIPTIDGHAGLGPVLRFVAGNKRRSHYPVRRRRAAGNGRGTGSDLFLAPFQLLPIPFNHGFKPRDVFNARFQL